MDVNLLNRTTSFDMGSHQHNKFSTDLVEEHAWHPRRYLGRARVPPPKGHPASRRRPKSQNRLRGHELVLIAAQHILVILKKVSTSR